MESGFLLPPAVAVTFFLLAATVVTAAGQWQVRGGPLWALGALLTIASGLGFGLITPLALIPLGLLTLSAWCALWARQRWMRGTGWLLTVPMALLLALHQAPGFHNALLAENVRLGAATLPYSLYANLDKGLAGAILLGLFVPVAASQRPLEPGRSLAWVGAVGLAVLVAGWAMGVPFDPKIGLFLLPFAFFNLVVTCVAEEVFFRWLVQRPLAQHLGRQAGFWAPFLTGLLFGLAHFHTGEDAGLRMTLITLAGWGYAAVYQITGRLGASVLTHFGVNLLHITLFVYPASFQ